MHKPDVLAALVGEHRAQRRSHAGLDLAQALLDERLLAELEGLAQCDLFALARRA